jgi:hypothetical protein
VEKIDKLRSDIDAIIAEIEGWGIEPQMKERGNHAKARRREGM